MASSRLRLFALSALALLMGGLAGCATNPVTGNPDFVLMSEDQEIQLGLQTHADVLRQYAVYEDPEINALVNRIGEELAAGSHRSNLDFTFTVLDSPEVNAFATPGGYIYITRGIMAYMNNEEQLAGVLGHEIGHVTARHSVRQHSAQTTTQTAAGLLGVLVSVVTGSNEAGQAVGSATGQFGNVFISGYGRSHELEADRLGAEYMATVGYDPQMMLGVVGILKDQEEFELQRAREEGRDPRVYHGVFATHPRNDQRLQEVIAAADRFRLDTARVTDPEAFLGVLEGMTFGSSPEQGIMQDGAMYHGPLDLHISFPPKWHVENTPASLVAFGPERDLAVVVNLSGTEGAASPEQFLRAQFDNLSDGNAIDGGGYTGIAHGETRSGPVAVRVSAVFHDDRVLVIQGMGRDRLPDAEVLSITRSIRTLTGDEQVLAAGHDIVLRRARAGETFASLAADSPLHDYAEDQLRLLNGMYPDGEPVAGQLLKVIQ